MNWFALYDKHLHVVLDASDPYFSVQENLDEETIVWSILRKSKFDDGLFNAAHVALDAWLISNPSVKYITKGRDIIYTNIIII